MQALGTLMASQVVNYDFGPYSLPMPVDAPVTVLSVGASLLKASLDLELPINTAGDFAPLPAAALVMSTAWKELIC